MPITTATLLRFQAVFGEGMLLIWAEEGSYFYGKLPKVSPITPCLGEYQATLPDKDTDKKLNANKQRLQKAIQAGDVVLGKII